MRKDQKLSQKYRKNQRFEEVITSLNDQLAKSQNQILDDVHEDFPTVHILGAPRSGTTLVSQLIPSFLPFGHINNLIAAFWKAPVYGVELSNKLLGNNYKSNFQSDFGRTSGINEPHEFGYFWNYHLKYEQLQQKAQEHEKNVDWHRLSVLLKNITHSYQRPVVFKSFLAGFHSHKLYSQLNKTGFIYLKRDLVDNTLSILKLRKELNGDPAIWGSIKPRQYEVLKNLTVYEQIVGQILCLEHEYMTQLENIPNKNKIIASYEEICANPSSFLKRISRSFLQNEDGEIEGLPNLEVKAKTVSPDVERKILNAKTKILKLFPGLKLLK